MQERTALVKKQQAETFARLTAPSHIVHTRFEKHERVEGYAETRITPGFIRCDRLLRQSNLFGTVQLGYDPKRQQSFLFAAIRTSIYDTAPSLEQRAMTDRQRMAQLKTGNQNRAFTAKRRANSAVLLYKAENRPWNESSLQPYLRRSNMEALEKTLPFLGAAQQQKKRLEALQTDLQLGERERQALQAGNAGEAALVRAERRALSEQLNVLGSLIWRKQSQTRLFFRRLNLAFDLQKQKMFEYYRNLPDRADAGPRQDLEELSGEDEDR